jgi:WD40 repeat protein
MVVACIVVCLLMIQCETSAAWPSPPEIALAKWKHSCPRHRLHFVTNDELVFLGGWPFNGPDECFVWSVSTGRRHPFIKSNGCLWPLAVSVDLKLFLTGGERGDLQVWSSAGVNVGRLDNGSHYTRAGVFDPGGKYIATGGHKVVALWSVANFKRHASLAGFRSQEISELAFAPDGKTLAVSDDNVVTLWEVATRKERFRFEPSRDGDAVLAFSPDGLFVAVGGGAKDPAIVIWSVVSRKIVARCLGHKGTINCLLYTNAGRVLLSGSSDGTVRAWDALHGKQIRTWTTTEGFVRGVAISPSGKLLAACDDEYAWIWPLDLVDLEGQVTVSDPWRQVGDSKESHQAGQLRIGQLWLDLGSSDAKKAYEAALDLIAMRDHSLTFLQKHLHVIRSVDEVKILDLIDSLDHRNFSVRETSHRDLERLGDLCAEHIRKALSHEPSPEARRRLELLLVRIDSQTLSDEEIRYWRAIEVLEFIGNEEAKQILERLRQGTADSFVTREAVAALLRMAKRQP